MKIITVLTLLLGLSWALFAHPASNATLSYDAKTQLLNVSFEHSVKNVAEHFISKVVIKIGGKEVISQSLSTQETAAGGSLVYKLVGVNTGAVIEAVTECNKVGKKSAKLTLK